MYRLDLGLREIKMNNREFGSCMLILLGDLLQVRDTISKNGLFSRNIVPLPLFQNAWNSHLFTILHHYVFHISLVSFVQKTSINGKIFETVVFESIFHCYDIIRVKYENFFKNHLEFHIPLLWCHITVKYGFRNHCFMKNYVV